MNKCCTYNRKNVLVASEIVITIIVNFFSLSSNVTMGFMLDSNYSHCYKCVASNYYNWLPALVSCSLCSLNALALLITSMNLRKFRLLARSRTHSWSFLAALFLFRANSR